MAFEPPELSSDETMDATRGHRERRMRAAGELVAARLAAAHPAGLDVEIDVAQETVVVGRNPRRRAATAIHDPQLSREHFAIAWDPVLRTHVAKDLGSRNGSWIDGVASTSGWRPLTPGSVLRAGSALYVYELGHTLEHPDPPEVRRAAVPGQAMAIRDLRAKLDVAAPDISPALIIGETGTGKEKIARELHDRSGRTGAFVAINCATFSEQLIESQLFGHKKGAFTGATSDQPGLFRAAEGGSLFLDEIGEMPLALQPKLLRAIQEKEIRSVGGTETEQVDVRIIAATHQDLVQRAKDKSFRQDLYARLALWQLEVPPVRERRRDVLSWVHRLYGAWREDRGMDEDRLDFDLEAAETLLLSKWSENLRGIDRFVHEIAARRPRGRLGINAIPSWVTA
ncbi:MAG: sigma-54-dependent Fis family transcriptional regulator [Deltaproteobacteria bacterium]|jgi:hypothetical protein